MNLGNRNVIIVLAALLVLGMAAVSFLAWAESARAIDALEDFAAYLREHNDNSGRLVVTLAALLVAVLSMLVIILELSPEAEPEILEIRGHGATLLAPRQAVAERLQDALLQLDGVLEAKVKPASKASADLFVEAEMLVEAGAIPSAVAGMAVAAMEKALRRDLGVSLNSDSRIQVTPASGPRLSEALDMLNPPRAGIGDQA